MNLFPTVFSNSLSTLIKQVFTNGMEFLILPVRVCITDIVFFPFYRRITV